MSSMPFVGRSAVLDAMQRCVDATVAHRPQLCLLHGGPGAGKTSVLQRFLDGLPDRLAATVLRASGSRVEATTGYGLLSQFDRRFVPLLDGSGAFPAPTKAGVDLLATLDDLQSAGPVVVAVDDAHWADDASLQALLFALRRLRRDRILTIVAFRPDELDADLDGYRRLAAEHGTDVGLDGLTAAELLELGRLVQRPITPRGAARLVAHTGGNPLYATELLLALSADQLEREPLLPAPERIEGAVARMQAACGEPGRGLIAAVAVLGDRCELGRAAAVAGVPDGAAAADDARRAGLLRDSGVGPATTLQFVHPLYESAVYSGLPLAERAALHRAAARRAEGEAEALRHLGSATAVPEPALAARAVLLADRQRGRWAFGAAAEWYVLAARLTDDLADREVLRWQAVDCLMQGGEIRRAAWTADETEQYGPPTAWRCYVTGTLALLRGNAAAADRLLERGWVLASQDGGDPAVAATIAAHAGLVALVAADMDACDRWADRALAASARAGVELPLARVLAAYGLWFAGDTEGALAACGFLDELDEEARLIVGIDARNGRLLLRLWNDDHAGVRADAAIMDRSLRRYGPSVYGAVSMANLAEVEHRCGNWDAALALSEAAMSLGADLGHSWHACSYPMAAAHVCAARGDWDDAERYVTAVSAAAVRNGDAASAGYAQSVQAALAFARGELEATVDAVPVGGRYGPHEVPGVFPCRLLRIDALLALGRLEEAADAIEVLESAAGRRSHRSSLAAAARLRGQLAAARADRAAASAHFEAAAAGFGALGMPFELARTEAAHGATLRRAGKRRQARLLLTRAAVAFSALGARPYLEPVLAELAALGVAPAATADRPLRGLTPQELAVARLVYEGRSNKEVASELFVSVKTVEFHLGNVYAKLGVRSRAQLTRLLAAPAGS